jgi:hypothetical protein
LSASHPPTARSYSSGPAGSGGADDRALALGYSSFVTSIAEPGMSQQEAKPIMIEVGPGELIDKITILRIKSERMTDEAKLANVRHELAVLDAARNANLEDSAELRRLEEGLKAVNEALYSPMRGGQGFRADIH